MEKATFPILDALRLDLDNPSGSEGRYIVGDCGHLEFYETSFKIIDDAEPELSLEIQASQINRLTSQVFHLANRNHSGAQIVIEGRFDPDCIKRVTIKVPLEMQEGIVSSLNHMMQGQLE